jgi:hypothetical protein
MVPENEQGFDKDLELLKINMMSDRALAYSTTWTALYFGMWISFNLVALQITNNIAGILFILGATTIIFFLFWRRMIIRVQGKNNIRVGQWLKKVQNRQSIGDWEKLIQE